MIASISSRSFLRAATAVLAVVVLASASQVMARSEFHVDGGGREQPWDNCTVCHGDNLLGDIGPSCFTRHEQLWPNPTENQSPNVDAGGPYIGVAGEPVQFDGSGTTDPDEDQLMYLWTYGDGTPPHFPLLDPTDSHVYEKAGSYTALLTVTDGVNLPVVVPVAGVLFVKTTRPWGVTDLGIGMESNGIVFWMDITGAIYFGNIGHGAGTMRGLVFDYYGGSSIFFAERR